MSAPTFDDFTVDDRFDPAPYDPAALATRYRGWAHRAGLAGAPVPYPQLPPVERLSLWVAWVVVVEGYRLDPGDPNHPQRFYDAYRARAGGPTWGDLDAGWRAVVAVAVLDTLGWVSRSGALTTPAGWQV